jgi:glycine dehydrogenase subunit 2
MGKMIFEKSVPGARAFSLPVSEVEPEQVFQTIPEKLLRKHLPALPEISEVETIRHFTALSRQAYGVDTGFYPLGSCTMKYNPKINEWAARLPGFTALHPLQHEETVQGALQLMYELDCMLREITGMDRMTLQPAAGAHGELTGAMIIRAYHREKGDHSRNIMLVPDSSHGTNPATANMLGFRVVEIRSNERGLTDIQDLRDHLGPEVAGLMLTNPNTLGLFEEDIVKIADMVHGNGGLLYYDGANANAIIGMARPGDMGFDIVHLNLHKTFATPHGSGGPGSGPVGVKAFLEEFLPVPLVEKNADAFHLNYDRPKSIGRVHTFYGNFGVLVKAYAYLKTLGARGIREVCENAVLNANYVRQHLRDVYDIPYDRPCKHEFVLSARRQKLESGVTALDIAKRIMDFGYHPPTIYFPLIIEEAMMIEPTETETREQLDAFIHSMRMIAEEAKNQPDAVKRAPECTPIRRVDEVKAARKPVLKWDEKPEAIA